jgi:hypothetical protein
MLDIECGGWVGWFPPFGDRVRVRVWGSLCVGVFRRVVDGTMESWSVTLSVLVCALVSGYAISALWGHVPHAIR